MQIPFSMHKEDRNALQLALFWLCKKWINVTSILPPFAHLQILLADI